MKNTFCPVCGYELGFTPWDEDHPSDEICPCCGVQFGYDDFVKGDSELRRKYYIKKRNEWVEGGSIWYSRTITPPIEWNIKEQLRKVQTS